MLWYRYRQVPGRQNRLPLADSGEAHVFKEPSCAKDGPRELPIYMAVVVWNGCARDATRRAYEWRPVDRWRQDSKDA